MRLIAMIECKLLIDIRKKYRYPVLLLPMARNIHHVFLRDDTCTKQACRPSQRGQARTNQDTPKERSAWEGLLLGWGPLVS